MSDGDKVCYDPLFVALTRPAVILGIHMFAFVGEVIVVGVIFLAIGNPLYLTIIIPIHAGLYAWSSTDPGAFHSLWIWTKTSGKCSLNSRFWGASSCSPLPVKKWVD